MVRDIINLDGHVFVVLEISGDALKLKITPLQAMIDESFVSTHLVEGKEMLGNTGGCLYQVTVVGAHHGEGLFNLCNGLRGFVYSGSVGYSIIPDQGVVNWVSITPTLLQEMPPLAEAKKAPRRMRAVVKQQYIEMLVVVDYSTIRWHDDQDVESYVLTLIRLASRILKDSSLGQSVELVVKKLVLLDEDLKIVPDVARSTKRFMRWKNRLQKRNGESYDLALLLTRVDLASGSVDHTGHAITGGICHSEANCVLVEEGGLSSSYTIAHEIGHSLGLGHDGEGDNDCDGGRYIMSATTYTSAQPPFWSPCSRTKLAELLRYEPYQCLQNKPSVVSSHQKPLLLPGEQYKRDTQCQLRHGSPASSCSVEDQCSMLWCKLPGRSCVTNQMAVADGTACTMSDGTTGMCINRLCSLAVNQTIVDGQWGEWSSWNNCSKACGVGVAYSERFCDSPKPSNGGRYCTGEQRRYRTCNVQDCPTDSGNDFRDKQCKLYGAKWTALDEGVHLKQNPCKLYCEAANEGVFKVFAAADGTRCRAGSLDVCVAGRCELVGCDGQLRSTAVTDRCGMCNGNGSTCVEKTGTQIMRHFGLNRVAMIPKGAIKVSIREKESTSNYIVAEADHDILFNGSDVNMRHAVAKVQFSGLDWEYGKPQDGPEYLTATGPSKEDVTVSVFAQEHCSGVEYSYLAPVDVVEPTMAEQYSWHFTFWSPCSVTCGQGVSKSVARCFNSQDEMVSPKKCKGLPKPRPKQQKRKCSLSQCTAVEYDWRYTKWSQCSSTCGGGVKTRVVQCMSVGSTPSVMDEGMCNQFKKAPSSTKPCNKKPCPFHTWSHGNWSDCSSKCGMGHMIRLARCNDALGNTVSDEKCVTSIKPVVRKECRGNGNRCDLLWQYTSWSECSASCGTGIRMRLPECRYWNGTIADTHLCEKHLGPGPPADSEECNSVDCSAKCIDSSSFSHCPLVRAGNLCHMENLRLQCCKTCKEAGFV